MNSPSEKYNNENLQDSHDEVDLGIIYRILLRKKIIILIISILGAFSSAIYSLLQVPIYKGSFQIFLKSEKNQNFSTQEANNLKSLLGSSLDTDLNTQVEILKSPLVLKPVFEFVQNSKINNKSSLKNKNYLSWRNSSLDVELISGTTILNVEYMDEDKELILSALKIISDRYKGFSKRDEIESLKKGEYFLETQIKNKKEKKTQLVNELNNYMIENNLGSLSMDGFLPENLNDENNFNKIESISIYEKKVTADRNLISLEAKCKELSFKLKPESKFLNLCKEKIAYQKEKLRRPNEILVNYSTMRRNLNTNNALLLNLENDLALLNLQKAKQIDPWELISDPFVEEIRISPRRKRITLSGGFISFLLAIPFILLQNKLGKYIYELSYFKKKIPFRYLGEIFAKNIDLSNKKLAYFLNSEISENDRRRLACFINKEDVEIKNILNKFKLKQYNNIYEINDLEENNIKSLVLFFEQGNVTKKQINLIIEYLSSSQINVIGWFFIDNEEAF